MYIPLSEYSHSFIHFFFLFPPPAPSLPPSPAVYMYAHTSELMGTMCMSSEASYSCPETRVNGTCDLKYTCCEVSPGPLKSS